jgi:hypothetical protein
VKKLFIAINLLFLALCSCSIEEGDGGQGEISGRVMVQVKYSNPILGIKDSIIKEYPAVKEKVYIQYGESTIYDNDFSTDGQGYYKFPNLTKGDYTLTVYSYCDTCDTGINVFEQKISLDSHKDKKTANTFNINPE